MADFVPEEQTHFSVEAVSVVTNRWPGLKKNQIHWQQHMFEFIDNSIAHRVSGVPLRIEIKLHQSAPESGTTYTEKIEIIDNSSGIRPEILGKCLTPDAMAGAWDQQKGSEHGYGMKPALASLSTSPSITSLPSGNNGFGYSITTEEIKKVVNGEGIEAIEYIEIDSITNHGTIITLNDLTRGKGRNVGMRKQGINTVNDFVLRIGQRYRSFLTDQEIFPRDDESSGIFVTTVSHKGKQKSLPAKACAPIYYRCPLTGVANSPVLNDVFTFKGQHDEWEAEVTIGIAPHENRHWKLISQTKVKKYHPYAISKKNAGFDIIHRGVVITTGWLPVKEDMPKMTEHGSIHNRIRGEIKLVSGFTSTRTKNMPDADDAWDDFLTELEKFLFRFDYHGDRDEEIDLMSKLLWNAKRSNNLTESQLVNSFKLYVKSKMESSHAMIWPGFPKILAIHPEEYSTNHGDVDLAFNIGQGRGMKIFVEAKAEEADAVDVYQLRAYMDAEGVKFGLIISKKLSKTGAAALEFLNSRRGLFGRRKYRILHIPSIDFAGFDSEENDD